MTSCKANVSSSDAVQGLLNKEEDNYGSKEGVYMVLCVVSGCKAPMQIVNQGVGREQLLHKGIAQTFFVCGIRGVGANLGTERYDGNEKECAEGNSEA